MSRIDLKDLRKDQRVRLYLERADKHLAALGYTEHGLRHAEIAAQRARGLLTALKFGERQAELAAMASFMHDMGNMISRASHGQNGAFLAQQILSDLDMPTDEVITVISAIANHEEEAGDPADAVTAAVILSDKSDVHRSRVRNPQMVTSDIHDRVNYAVTQSSLNVDVTRKEISLELQIDTSISQVMEYFEIFLARMLMAKKSAKILECNFKLMINDVELA